MPTVSPTQSNVQAALLAFLEAVFPGLAGTAPAVFTGSISGTTLTVSTVVEGSIAPGAPLLGAAPGTIVVQQLTGPMGGAGTYQVSLSQTIANPTGTTMATGVDIIAGLGNRAAEPANPWFVIMTPIRFERKATNVDAAADCKFVGSIAGTTLDVSSIASGSIDPQTALFGSGVAAGTVIVQQLTGTPGGIGTYQVAPSQTLASGTLSAGQNVLVQKAIVTVQLDFHAPDTTANDMAQTVSTALRDEYGTDFFAALAAPLNEVVPLYADDPRMIPFINAEDQFEWRAVLECELEANQSVTVPQQYADSATLTIVDVTATWPGTP